VATNENGILHRFFQDGKYHRMEIQHSISPSMDICVSSNELAKQDPVVLNKWMKDFESTKELTLSRGVLTRAQSNFLSAKADTKQTLAVIKKSTKKSIR
jgi:threonine synthase